MFWKNAEEKTYDSHSIFDPWNFHSQASFLFSLVNIDNSNNESHDAGRFIIKILDSICVYSIHILVNMKDLVVFLAYHIVKWNNLCDVIRFMNLCARVFDWFRVSIYSFSKYQNADQIPLERSISSRSSFWFGLIIWFWLIYWQA